MSMSDDLYRAGTESAGLDHCYHCDRSPCQCGWKALERRHAYGHNVPSKADWERDALRVRFNARNKEDDERELRKKIREEIGILPGYQPVFYESDPVEYDPGNPYDHKFGLIVRYPIEKDKIWVQGSYDWLDPKYVKHETGNTGMKNLQKETRIEVNRQRKEKGWATMKWSDLDWAPPEWDEIGENCE